MLSTLANQRHLRHSTRRSHTPPTKERHAAACPRPRRTRPHRDRGRQAPPGVQDHRLPVPRTGAVPGRLPARTGVADPATGSAGLPAPGAGGTRGMKTRAALLGVTLAVSLAITGCSVVDPHTQRVSTSSTGGGTEWDAGNIFSDQVLYNGNALPDETAVQAAL